MMIAAQRTGVTICLHILGGAGMIKVAASGALRLLVMAIPKSGARGAPIVPHCVV